MSRNQDSSWRPGDAGRGFTLIEVLASMAVLVVIMLALMRIFTEASGSMTRGVTSVTRAASARAAMELITRDFEGAVIDSKLGMYKEGNTDAFGGDRIGFVTMAGDQDDGRAYLLVQYFVTNSVENGFTNRVLKRFARTFKASLDNGVDPLDSPDHEWWKRNLTGFGSGEVIANNVVRFDLFICEPTGRHMYGNPPFFGSVPNSMYSSATGNDFSDDPFTKTPPAKPYPSNIPPAYLDVYLQVTSDDTMKKASFLLNSPWNSDLNRKGRTILTQDSLVLQSRIVPIMGYAERLHPIIY
ncbi:MAG: prepilin-type N-terminal cleavage/methylation domain-containing protein [bacterium]